MLNSPFRKEPAMSTDILLTGVPEAVLDALRRRATEHRRSVSEEAVEVLEAGTGPTPRPKLTFMQLVAEARASGMSTPAESAAMIREDRDGGHCR